jgi:hypothetical protein
MNGPEEELIMDIGEKASRKEATREPRPRWVNKY